MQWRGRRQSSNVEDRRRGGGFGGLGGLGGLGGGGGFGGGITKGGIGLVVLFLVISLISGQNPLELLNLQSPTSNVATTDTDEAAEFVKVVLADNEDVWNAQIRNFRMPTLVLFRGATQSACGYASAATGPFYCPGDEKIYIDLSFYDDLKTRFQAPGDFAMAYVVAHEYGHHLQKLSGVMDRVHNLREQLSESEYNELSVKLELQADFYAGVWAHHAQNKNILEEGDIQEALNAASAIGDDRIQMQSQGYIVPESFTHGTSEQRMYWFKRGFETGDVNQGDTFSENF